MSGVDPEITLNQDGPLCYSAQMEYTADALDEMARRAAERIEDELVQQILARLGYVKVVRCRECRRVTIDQGDHDYREPLWCGLFRMDVSLDGYCAWGERKEEHE